MLEVAAFVSWAGRLGRSAALGIAIATLAGLAIGCGGALPPSDLRPDIDQVPGPVTATALDGFSLELPQRGHITVVDVWATWCGPCVDTMPALETLWLDGRSSGVRVVGVATDDNPGLVERSARRREITYPNIVDASGEVRGWLKVRDLPTIVVFDRHGRIRWLRRGATAGDVEHVRGVVATLEREG